jgi:aminoglycoside phosphotransferase (APT) family kinase protein
MTAERERFQRLAERLSPGSAVTSWRRLEGGVSANVTAVDVTLPDGGIERVVVRRHGAIDKGHNPDIATTEFRVLEAVHAAGLAVPAPLLLDQSGEIFGEPCLVTAFVEGATGIAPDAVAPALAGMARYLARLHALDYGRLDLPALPRRDDPIAGTLTDLPDPQMAGGVRDALNGRALATPINAPALLHGDFWPGNVMWRDGEIAAVLDWEDAAIGDPLADLAGCRIELLWALDERAMDAFTRHYLALAPVDTANLPFWELRAAVGASARMQDWGLDPAIEADMRRKAAWLIDRALARVH